jgi:hypothetical protein
VNKRQSIAQLVDKAQTLENGSQNLIAHVRPPTQHVIIIDRGWQQANRRPSVIFCKSFSVIACLSNDLQKQQFFPIQPDILFQNHSAISLPPTQNSTRFGILGWGIIEITLQTFPFRPEVLSAICHCMRKTSDLAICIRGVPFVIRHEGRGKIRQCVNPSFK